MPETGIEATDLYDEDVDRAGDASQTGQLSRRAVHDAVGAIGENCPKEREVTEMVMI